MRDRDGPMEVVTALVRAAFVVNGAYAASGRETAVTPQQGQLLCVLRSGAYGMGELSTALGLARSTTTGLVDGIERHGLAARQPSSHDSRAVEVNLTAHGREVADDFYARTRARIEEFLAPLKDTDQQVVAELLGQLVDGSPAAMIFTDVGPV